MKKEHYFTQENREMKIKEWKEILSEYYSSKKKFRFTIENTALLIIDMQEYFLNPNSHAYVPSSPTIIDPILQLKEKFHEKNNFVCFVQYGLDTNYNYGMMTKWWKGLLTKEDPLFALSPIMEVKNELVIVKSTYDSFVGNNLADILSKLGYNKVVIVGVTTHLCCESTARSAFEYDMEVYLPIDCLASYNEDLHISSLKVASHGFGIPITSQEILESIK
ncbi:MAG: cysteine hydrolase [Asgard group archaeon]|nr:cysteine hydrolase [Asgard group archaeon]